jgi:hypothetical protein
MADGCGLLAGEGAVASSRFLNHGDVRLDCVLLHEVNDVFVGTLPIIDRLFEDVDPKRTS